MTAIILDWLPGPSVTPANVDIDFFCAGTVVDNRTIFGAQSPMHLTAPQSATNVRMTVYPWTDHLSAASEIDLTTGARSLTVSCPAIADKGPLGWWHDYVGIRGVNPRRGSGISIGVIDDYIDATRSVFADVEDLGHVDPMRSPRPSHGHGEQVLSLIVAKTPFEGMAPGAAVSFISAQGPYAPDKLSPAMLEAAIERLADEESCDIISISAGDYVAPMPGLLDAVRYAESCGALCIFAGGNRAGAPLYPASYNEVVAVGALGKCGVAPGSLMHDNEAASCLADNKSFYLLDKLAFGPELTCVSPGIGVVTSFDGRTVALSGTSFAAPIAAGVLAVRLAGDRGYKSKSNGLRAAHARAVLDGALRPCGFGAPALWVKTPRVGP